jgi:ribosomal protein S18 acetylase RimI-like enzyme
MQTEIREAEVKDLDVIEELSVKLSAKESEEFDSTINPEWSSTEEAKDYFRERINEENGFAIVIENEGQVVGYALGSITDAEACREDLEIAELGSMYIMPEYRSQGIGTELMEQFTSWSEEKDADRLRVEATAQNKDAIRFYRENGFEDYALTLEREL